jgi:hypothetical protein
MAILFDHEKLDVYCFELEREAGFSSSLASAPSIRNRPHSGIEIVLVPGLWSLLAERACTETQR